MHYLFQRRLNMVDVALNKMKDGELQDTDVAQQLLQVHKIEIPALKWEKAKYEVKKERLTSENAPPEFTIRHGQEYDYLLCTIPFSDDEFISDIFKMTVAPEGLTIKPNEIEYKEYSHDGIEENGAEYQRIRHNARKVAQIAEQRLDEFAADAVEFNQVFLPAAITDKLAAERKRRVVHRAEKSI